MNPFDEFGIDGKTDFTNCIVHNFGKTATLSDVKSAFRAIAKRLPKQFGVVAILREVKTGKITQATIRIPAMPIAVRETWETGSPNTSLTYVLQPHNIRNISRQ